MSLAPHTLTSYPTMWTIKASEKPSRMSKRPNGLQDRSRWQLLSHRKSLDRRKDSCYPFLDGLFQRVGDRFQNVLVDGQVLYSGISKLSKI